MGIKSIKLDKSHTLSWRYTRHPWQLISVEYNPGVTRLGQSIYVFAKEKEIVFLFTWKAEWPRVRDKKKEILQLLFHSSEGCTGRGSQGGQEPGTPSSSPSDWPASKHFLYLPPAHLPRTGLKAKRHSNWCPDLGCWSCKQPCDNARSYWRNVLDL